MAIVAVSLAITWFFSSITLYTPPPNIHDEGIVRLFPNIKQYQQADWSLFMLVEAFSFAVGMLVRTEQDRSHRRELEAQRDRAEINLLKARINPHFMFNTLNSLYGLFLTGNQKALPSLEKFIEMTRYIHNTSVRESVPLHEESDHIRRLIDLQSLRLNDKTRVDLNIHIENPDLPMPPMLLVTFVENCFKHGVSPTEPGIIYISLTEHNGILEFSTSNRIFPSLAKSDHTGIDNCRRRLDLCFPNRHSLHITEGHDNFSVKLTIHLDTNPRLTRAAN